MIGFSIMMWFSSALLIFFSISLLKGNYSSVHGKVFETTNDKNGYAKALGKPFSARGKITNLRSDTILSENQIVLDSNAEIGE